jgi:hypothetical protein
MKPSPICLGDYEAIERVAMEGRELQQRENVLRSRGILSPSCPLFSLLPGELREFPTGGAVVLEKEPLSLAIDFVAIQIVLVRPVSVVRDDAQSPP